MNLSNKLIAELIGTFWLVLGGCGSAVLAAALLRMSSGIGLLGVALAFGLTVLTMAYAIGHISGCHLNPAVSVGLVVGGRFPAGELIPYIIAQVLGAIAAAFLLYFIASGQAGFTLAANRLAVNGYGDLSPGKYSHDGRLRHRGGHDRHVPVHHPGRHRQARLGRASPAWPSASP